MRILWKSGSTAVFIDEVASRGGVPRLFSLFLAIGAVPLLGEVLLLDAGGVKPLSFAVGIFAGDHFSEGGAAAVAILWFFGVIVEILFFVGCAELVGVQFHLLALEDLLLGFLLVLVLELGGQHLLVLSHLAVKLIRDFFLLLCVTEQLFLLAEDRFVVCLQLWGEFCGLALPEFLDLREKFGLQLVEGELKVFDAFVEFADEAQVSVDVVGDGDHLVHEIIEVCVRHLIEPNILFQNHSFPLYRQNSRAGIRGVIGNGRAFVGAV